MDDLSDNIEITEGDQREADTDNDDPCDEFGRSLKLLAWKPVDTNRLNRKQLEVCHSFLRKGDFSWYLHPEQTKLHEWLTERERFLSAVVISRQFGKTTMMLTYCLAHCLKHPASIVLFLAPTKTQLLEIILPKMSDLFAYFPDDLLPHKNGLVWTFPNGSILRLDGLAVNKGTKIRGTAVDLCVIDECRDVIRLTEVIESVIVPMFTTRPNGRIILISTPPDSPAHDFVSKYVNEAIHEGNFYSATYKQNPLLSTKRLREMFRTTYKGGENNLAFRREYMADFAVADDEKRVVREWNEVENDMFLKGYHYPEYPVRIYVGMDYGFSDPCGLLCGFFDYEHGSLIVCEEWFQRGRQTDEVGEQVVSMEKRMREKLKGSSLELTTRIMDIDPSLAADLRTRWQLQFEPVYKVPSKLVMVNRLRTAFNLNRIYVMKSCPELRFQLKTGIYNEKQTDYVRTQRTGHLDLLTALLYMSLNLRWNEVLKHEEPTYLKHNEIFVGQRSGNTSFGNFALRRPI